VLRASVSRGYGPEQRSEAGGVKQAGRSRRVGAGGVKQGESSKAGGRLGGAGIYACGSTVVMSGLQPLRAFESRAAPPPSAL
jgi:hypothetical protein